MLVYVENVSVLFIEGYTVVLVIFVHSCLITLGKKKSLFGELEQAKKVSLYVLVKCFCIIDGIHMYCQTDNNFQASRKACGNPELVV